jgi:hypothetical protein
MFFAYIGKDSDTDLFAYFLADRLGKTLSELDDMPYAEYVGWSSYHKVKQQQESLARKAALRGT